MSMKEFQLDVLKHEKEHFDLYDTTINDIVITLGRFSKDDPDKGSAENAANTGVDNAYTLWSETVKDNMGM